MTINEFIEKAIEGGWDRYVWTSYIRNETSGRSGYGTRTIPIDSVFLDPLAWKAVGKTEGWGKLVVRNDLKEDEWRVWMHRMIDALCEGKTIESYLETL